MNSTKRILFIVLIAASFGLAFWSYLQLKKSKRPKTEAISLLPDQCLVYCKTSNFFELSKRINSQSLIVDKLKSFGPIDTLCRTMEILDSLLWEYEPLRHELQSNTLHLALYGEGDEWLMALNLHQLGNQTEIEEALHKQLHARPLTDGVFTFIPMKGYEYCYILKNGTVLISNRTALIKKALDPTESKWLTSNSYNNFKQQLTTDQLLSVFLNHALYEKASAKKLLNLTAFCGNGYSTADISIEPSEIRINGFLQADTNELISTLSNQESQSPDDFMDLLPNNTAAFSAFGFSDFKEIYRKLQKQLPLSNFDFWKKVNHEALYNVNQDFANNIKNHLLYFKTTFGRGKFIAIPVKDTLLALEHLRAMSDTLLELKGHTYRLKNTKANNNLHLFYPFFNSVTNVACLIKSHLVFSENETNLLMLQQQLENNKLTTTNESFLAYKNQHITNSFNYLCYASPNQNPEEIKNFINFRNQSSSNPFDNFKHFSFSVMNDKEHFKFRLQLMNEAASNKESQMLWAYQLDTTCKKQAFPFVNHNNHENEVVIQDDASTLYLVNAKGSLIWKKNIGENIISNVWTVDVFKNNKYQMLFNTKTHIHLIDRNGNYVKGFPVRLPSPATSPLSLQDYDNNKDYRILVSCENKYIYNYNSLGIPLEGYTPVKTLNQVDLPVQYAKVGSSDYLVAVDVQGRIYIFSRKGLGRIGLTNRTVVNCKNFYLDASNTIQNTYLVYHDDKSGLINKISFVDEKELIKLNLDTESADVCYGLVDDNRAMDMIITRQSGMCAYNFSGDLLLEINSKELLSKGGYFNDESHSVFYALNETKNHLMILNEPDKSNVIIEASALPLISNLFNNNKKYVLVANGKQLCCLLLN